MSGQVRRKKHETARERTGGYSKAAELSFSDL